MSSYRNPYNGYSEEENGYGTQSGETDNGEDKFGTHRTQTTDWTSGKSKGNHVDIYGHHQQGSQSPLVIKPDKVARVRWSMGSEFLFSSWSFSLSLYSIWSLPISVARNGGLVFLLIYGLLALLVAGPVLLLEMFLGQYSGLSPIRLWIHICPLLSGVGYVICLVVAVRSVLELATLAWMGKAMLTLFTNKNISQNFFNEDILDQGDSGLENIGHFDSMLLLVLAIASLTTFVLVVAGTKAIGKVSILTVPACLMLIVTLTVRSCLAPGGPQGVLTLLNPDWTVLKDPTVWMEATGQLIFSLQLGLGAVSAYSRYNHYQHNIIKDVTIILVSHLVWVLLGTILTFSLLGAAHQSGNLSLHTQDPLLLVSMTGHDIWLAFITLVEKSFTTLDQGWLWAGFYFILLCLVAVTSLFGYLEVITSSLVSIHSSLPRLKPLITFCVLFTISLVDLVLVTQGGIEVYHLVSTYLPTWPATLICLLTVIAATLCHGTKYLMRDLSDMSNIHLPHWVTSHLSVSYYTTIPALLLASTCWTLYNLSLDHLLAPLSHFNLSLSSYPYFTLPLAWSLMALPALPLVAGGLFNLVWVRGGVPFDMHLKRIVKPTDQWYENEHLENVLAGPRGTEISTSKA